MRSGRRLQGGYLCFLFLFILLSWTDDPQLAEWKALGERGEGVCRGGEALCLLGDASSRTETVVLPATACSFGRKVIAEMRRQREADVWIAGDHVVEFFWYTWYRRSSR
jgi:hypothetical protein